ncbi:MAG TPA: YkvA family protein [Ancylobacter sp.]
MSRLDRLKSWAKALKCEILALWIASRNQRTPWYAKLAAGLVAAYALSPIDLIPDVIPVLGYLDDLIIVPLGIVLAVRLIPPEMMADYRQQAAILAQRPVSRGATVAVALIWVAGAVGLTYWIYTIIR